MRTLILLIFAATLAAQSSAQGPVTLFGPQTILGAGGSTLSIAQTAGPCSTVSTCAFTNPTTTGNSIVVEALDNSAATPTYADAVGGDSYTTLTPCQTGNTNNQFVIAYAKNITGHAAPTVTQTGGNPVTIWLFELSGVSTTSPLDISPCTTLTLVTNPIVSAAFTTSSANEVVIVGIGTNGGETYSIQTGSGYTLLAQDSLKRAGVEYQAFSTVQSGVTAGVTQGGLGNLNWAVFVTGWH